MDKASKKILKISFCLLLSAVALLSSCFMKKGLKKETAITHIEENESSAIENIPGDVATSEQGQGTVNTSVNEAEPELWLEEGMEQIEVYFTNTKDIDTGKLPLEAQSILTDAVQSFLKKEGIPLGEVRVREGSVIRMDDSVQFLCTLPDWGDKMLYIEYKLSLGEFVFELEQ